MKMDVKQEYSNNSNNSVNLVNLNNISIIKIKEYITSKRRMTYEEILWEFRLKEGLRDDEKIVDANLSLVFSIASRMYNHHRKCSDNDNKTCDVQLIDLFQAGVLGLNTAIKKYDSTLNTQFSTYAYPWISQRVREEIRRAIYTLKTYQYAPVFMVDLEEEHYGVDSSFFKNIEYKELLSTIEGILDKKELNYFNLYFIKGLRMADISKTVDKCISTVQYHIRNIKEKLQLELSNSDYNCSFKAIIK